MIKLYNQEARWVINNEISKIEDSNIIKYRTYVIVVNSRIIDKAIRKAIRVINAWIVELNYIVSKYLEYYYLIDIEIRNTFKKDLLLSVLKCYYSFNICRIIDNIINIEKTD